MADVLHITRCGRHALRSDESGPSGECGPCREVGYRMAKLEAVAAAARSVRHCLSHTSALEEALAALNALDGGRTDG